MEAKEVKVRGKEPDVAAEEVDRRMERWGRRREEDSGVKAAPSCEEPHSMLIPF